MLYLCAAFFLYSPFVRAASAPFEFELDRIMCYLFNNAFVRVVEQDTVGDKALRVVDGAIYVAKSAPLGTAVKVISSLPTPNGGGAPCL